MLGLKSFSYQQNQAGTMANKQKAFKIPPKKYQPKGISILYEDSDILVVDKTHGLLTMGNETVRENTAYFLLGKYVKKENPKSRNRVFIVHRLDRDTSGVLVFAKHERAKRFLQEEWQSFEKIYYAVVHGRLLEKEGTVTSYLAENQAYQVYSVKDPAKGKLAKTEFKVLRHSKKYTLLEIHLHTGRKNQIRVHFSEKGFPLVGDRKYGKKEKGMVRLTLHAGSLTLTHPRSKERMTFETKMPQLFNSLVT